jgi:hypothetical protein
MPWLLLACNAPIDAPVEFELDPIDLGEARAASSGLDLHDGEAVGASFPSIMPGWEESAQPLWDVPTGIWEIALHERVADEGVCPFVTLDGADATYQSNCRSKHGYEWEGSAHVSRSEEGGVDRERWDFELRVVGDVEGARFESLSLQGSVAVAESGGVSHIDVNLQAELLGYFEARGVDDPRAEPWSDWQATGSSESVGSEFRLSVAANVGGSGGFALAGTGLSVDSACPVEPTGTGRLNATADVSFEGVAGCDACATVNDGEETTLACAP